MILYVATFGSDGSYKITGSSPPWCLYKTYVPYKINAWPLQNVCIVRFAPSVGVLDFIPWNSMGDISDLPTYRKRILKYAMLCSTD